MMRRYYPFLVSLFCLLLFAGCKLTITTFGGPDTAETGTVVPLTISCTATNISDGSNVNGVVLEIPSGMSVIYADASSGGSGSELAEDASVAGMYSAEAGHVIWAGTHNSLNIGTEGAVVSFTIKLLVGNISENIGQTQGVYLKAVVGAKRGDTWITDDPENIYDFADITDQKYQKSITVTQAGKDTTAPDPVNDQALQIVNNGDGTDSVRISWSGYNENAQGDVVSYRIYRSSTDFVDVSGMIPIDIISAGNFIYYDNTVMSDNGYFYAVTAIDEAGNENTAVNAGYVFIYSPGSISGTLYKSDDNTRITGETIWVYAYNNSCSNNAPVGEALIDSETAEYTITGLQPGTYYLRSIPSGNYISEWWASGQSVMDCNSAEGIVLSAADNITGIDFKMALGASISGTVYQSDGGSPLIGQEIEICAAAVSPCNNWDSYLNSIINYAIVDTMTGTYTIQALPPGTYYLLAYPYDSYLYQFWASPVSTWRGCEAQGVVVTGTENIIGKDFRMISTDSIHKGDINGDGSVDLIDLIESLKILAGKNIEVMTGTDVDQNGKTGMAEAIYVMQVVSGMRTP